jgi:hypothetical protein
VSFKKFGTRMRGHGEAVVVGSARIQRRAALAIDAAVVVGTPVDTGRARANWQAELDQPASGVLPAYSEGKGGSTAGANTQAAIDQATAKIEQHQPGQVIHITNNLHYIGRLNDGWSAQAPAGFVETAVQIGVEAVQLEAETILEGDR